MPKGKPLLSKFNDFIEEEKVYSIRCCTCNDVHNHVDVSKTSSARYFKTRGWWLSFGNMYCKRCV